MVKICKDCKHYREIQWYGPRPIDDYHMCEHPSYYKRNIVTGVITYYNCMDMRTYGPCKLKGELFEAK